MRVSNIVCFCLSLYLQRQTACLNICSLFTEGMAVSTCGKQDVFILSLFRAGIYVICIITIKVSGLLS